MLHIAIAEDERSERSQLEAQIRQFIEEHGLRAEIHGFELAQPLLDSYASGEHYDIILLDIQMPGIDGMTAAASIRNVDPDVLIIFITSMAQYAVQGYKVNAFDFLVKPVTQEALTACLLRALRLLKRRMPSSLHVRSGAEVRIVPVERILYAEHRNHRTLLCTQEEEIPCSCSIRALEEQLLPHGFFRCHSAFMVNLAKVERLVGADMIVGSHCLPLSKHRRKQFLSALAAYWGERG